MSDSEEETNAGQDGQAVDDAWNIKVRDRMTQTVNAFF